MHTYPYLLPSIEFSDLERVAFRLFMIDTEVVDTGVMPEPELGFVVFTSKPVPSERQRILHLKPFE